MATKLYEFNPDYAIHPGEYLSELIYEKKMTQVELSQRAGMTTKGINEIIQGKSGISPETALKLEIIFGTPAKYWIDLDSLYKVDIAKKSMNALLESQKEWLNLFDYNEMVKLNWLPIATSFSEKIKNLLSFFGFSSIDAWNEYYTGPIQVCFRQGTLKNPKIGNTIAWLKKGELEANNIDCPPFSIKKFEDGLKQIRALTVSLPIDFLPQLHDICKSAGVIVILTKSLPGTGICGATRRIKNDKTALIQMSLRYKTNDHFWFTFFHEAAHVLKHGNRLFFEGINIDDVYEDEANLFSQNVLIDEKSFNNFIKIGNFSGESIVNFARQINLQPGIVVGRLQHEGKIEYQSRLNCLKDRFKWAE